MTSSEPPFPEGPAPQGPAPQGPDGAGARDSEPPAPAPTIAAGHLHPGMLFLRMLDGFRAMILPLLLGVVAQWWFFAVLAIAFFVLNMMHALARYLTFQYRLTTEELITTEGILHRQERRIPVNRIQDLSFESTILRRMCGLVVVIVETASGKGAEARLDSLGRARAEQLRESLYTVRRRRGEAAGGPEQGTAPSPEYLLFRTSAGELMLRGMTDARLGAVLVALGAVWEFSGQLGFEQLVGGAVGQAFDWMAHKSWPLLVLILLAGLFVALLASMTVSMLGMLMVFHDFTLTLREDVVQRRYGLLTTRAATLPMRKIQRVLLEQNVLRRWLGMTVVRADSAGSGMDEAEEVKTGRDLIVPLTQKPRGEALVPYLLPGLLPWELDWHRVSPRLILRVALKGVLGAGLLVALGMPTVGPWILLALVLIPVSWAVGFLAYHNLGWTCSDEHVGMRWGILGRYRSLMPYRKVQAVSLRAGPVERILGLATLTVFVAGGSPTSMANLTRSEAERVQEVVVREAAARRFVW